MPAPPAQPVYRTLLQQLHQLLRNGDFAEGDRFLTERQVSDRFSVSRPTANKALASMVAEGVLEFRKGVGTFIRGRVLDYDIGALVSFTRKAELAGKRPSTQLLTFEDTSVAAAPPDVGSAIGLPDDTPLYFIERLRLADGVPVILERRHVVAAHCPDLQRKALHGSIYRLWTEDYALNIGDATQLIRVANLRGADAQLLGVRPGAAAFEVHCTGFLRHGPPLWHEITLYRGDLYEFHHQKPATGRLMDIPVDPIPS